MKKSASMAFYQEREELYMETNPSDEGLGAHLLQVRNRMWFPQNEAPVKTTLQPIVLASKSLTIAETH